MLASIKDVFFGYLDKTILENINVTIQEGDRVGLVGPNGEGKTTLLNLVFGDLIPDQGEISRKTGLRTGYFRQNALLESGLSVFAEMKEVYSNLTQYLCVILTQTFEEYGVVPKIKWPNDIQINSKKISGILAEGVIEHGKLEGLILGFGINLNTKKELLEQINQPATSLNIETGNIIDKEIFLKKLLERFCLMYDRFIEKGFILIRDEYIRRACFLNKEINVKVFDKTISGIAKDVTENGALKLIDNENKEHVLLIGDIL